MTLWAGHSRGGQEPAGPGEDQESIQQPQARAWIRGQSSSYGAPGLHTPHAGSSGQVQPVRNSLSLFQEHFPAVALVSRLCS